MWDSVFKLTIHGTILYLVYGRKEKKRKDRNNRIRIIRERRMGVAGINNNPIKQPPLWEPSPTYVEWTMLLMKAAKIKKEQATKTHYPKS